MIRHLDDVRLTDKIAAPLCVLVSDVLADLQRMEPIPRDLKIALEGIGEGKFALSVAFVRVTDTAWTTPIGAKIRAACVVQLGAVQSETKDENGETLIRFEFSG